MPISRPWYLVTLFMLMVLTLFAGRSFAAATPAKAPAPDAVLPDAPLPQSSSPSTQQQPAQQSPVQQAGSAVQQAGTTAINTVTTTANQMAHRSVTLGEHLLNEVDAGYLGPRSKWDVTIYRGERPYRFTGREKIEYAEHEEWSPFTVFDAAWSAGYEQLRNGVPHYGSDSGAYGDRLGAAAFRQGTYRMFGDGVFPAMMHEDPRYYRVAVGSVWHRGTRSALQVLMSHRDDGSVGFNYSCIAGEAVSNTLPLSIYPQRDVHASTVLVGIGISLLDDAALKLNREFLPDLLRAARLIPPQTLPK